MGGASLYACKDTDDSYLHGHAHVRPLECRRVVDTIARHARLVPASTQRLHDQELVLLRDITTITIIT